MKALCLRNTFLFIVLFMGMQVYGQEKTVLAALQNKDWMLLNSPVLRYYDVIERLSQTEYKEIMVYEGKEYSIKGDYYLSNDSISTSFEHQKVGKIPNGKYIVALFTRKDGRGNTRQEIMISEILELTDTYFKRRILNNGIVLEYRARQR